MIYLIHLRIYWEQSASGGRNKGRKAGGRTIMSHEEFNLKPNCPQMEKQCHTAHIKTLDTISLKPPKPFGLKKKGSQQIYPNVSVETLSAPWCPVS